MLFFAQPDCLHFAQKLGCHADVGGNLFLRQAVYEGRITLAKQVVALLGAQTEVVEQALAVGHQRIFGDDAKEPLKFWHFQIQLFLIFFGQQQQFRFFQRVDVEASGLLGDQAVHVGDPPIGRRELQDVFKTVGIDGIAPQAALGDKSGVSADVLFAQQKLLFFDFFGDQQGNKMCLLRRGKRDVFGDVAEDEVVGHDG